jgi:hypothetical protein
MVLTKPFIFILHLCPDLDVTKGGFLHLAFELEHLIDILRTPGD